MTVTKYGSHLKREAVVMTTASLKREAVVMTTGSIQSWLLLTNIFVFKKELKNGVEQ